MNENSDGASSLENMANDLVMTEPQGQPEPEEAEDQTEVEEIEIEEVAEADEVDDDQPEVEVEDEQVTEATDDELFYEVDGEEVSASQLKEWRKNGMLEADYTKKSQQNAEERKALEADREATQQLRAQLQDALASVAIDPDPQPDWAKLNQELDPKEFKALELEWQQKQAQKQQAAQAYQALQQQQQQEVLAREQAAILQHFPDWADKAKFEAALPPLAAQAEKFGFSREEFGGIVDHRMYLALSRVAELEAQVAQVGKAADVISKRVVKAKPRLQAGSKPVTGEAQSKAAQKKQDRFQKTGSLNDFAATLISE